LFPSKETLVYILTNESSVVHFTSPPPSGLCDPRGSCLLALFIPLRTTYRSFGPSTPNGTDSLAKKKNYMCQE